MNALILSSNLLDPIAVKVSSMVGSRLGEGLRTHSFADFEADGFSSPIDVAIVLLNTDSEWGLDLVRQVRQTLSAPVMAIGQINDPKFILRALQNGAEYFLNQEELDTELDTGLSRFSTKQDVPQPTGRLLAILSASGGTGASTLAANIATVIARDERKCVLIDLKPGRGDLASLLDLKPQFTLADLCQNTNRLDRTMFEKMLVHHTSGVALLGSPQRFTDIRRVTPNGISQGLRLARTFFPCTVVDVEDCFHEEQVVALREANGILLTTRLDFTSLRNAKRIIEHLQDIGIQAERMRIVVSRYGQSNELPADEAEGALGRKIAHFIPEDPKTVNGANNSGVPVVLRAPNSKVSLAIMEIARGFSDRRKARSSGQWLLGKLLVS
jgi:pilus assembly protein CpaE